MATSLQNATVVVDVMRLKKSLTASHRRPWPSASKAAADASFAASFSPCRGGWVGKGGLSWWVPCRSSAPGTCSHLFTERKVLRRVSATLLARKLVGA